MWSEEFDKKAQDAARNHSPSYDDRNWDKMQTLLDKHLPIEKKKRRFIFWWFLPVLMGISTYIFLTFDKKDKNTESITNGKNTKADASISNTGQSTVYPSPQNRQNNVTELKTEKPLSDNSVSKNDIVRKTETSANADNVIPQVSSSRQSTQTISRSAVNPPTSVVKKKGTNSSFDRTAQAVTPPTVVADISTAQNSPTSERSLKEEKVDGKTETVITDNTESKEPVADPKTTEISASKSVSESNAPTSAPRKTPKSRDKGFFAGISLGPDVSGFNMESGKWQLQYGLTAGYAFSKHWSVRTGFLAARKIYTAAPSDYHPPYNLSQYYPGIQKIDADCYVFEIPLTAVYNFAASKKHNWFVSTGLSTYLMKEETYEYYYKNSWGQMETRTKKVENENNHFFSIINISGGYKYQLSKHVFLMAEPYVKIPVSGVGYGNVKLNSAGMLFTIGTKF